jgi:hypothetical protein
MDDLSIIMTRAKTNPKKSHQTKKYPAVNRNPNKRPLISYQVQPKGPYLLPIIAFLGNIFTSKQQQRSSIFIVNDGFY